MSHFDDLSGQEFGIWKVLEFDHMKYLGTNHLHGMSYYKCRCKKCGQTFILARSQLTQRHGHYHKGVCSNGII